MRMTQGAPLQCWVAVRIFSCIKRRTVASLTLRTAAASSRVASPRSARSALNHGLRTSPDVNLKKLRILMNLFG